MIRELNSGTAGHEKIGRHFSSVPFDDPLFYRNDSIEDRLFQKRGSDTVIEGFDDLLSGQSLGAGLYDNHVGGIYQLAFALAISSSTDIDKIIDKSNPGTSSEIIKQLREKQVLAALKIIDLGCGSAAFAMTLKSLGANVYTVDNQDIPEDRKTFLDKRHIVADLNDEDIAERLRSEVGTDFDLVTENIICTELGRRIVFTTHLRSAIQKIALTLLKKGGYVFSQELRTFHDQVLRKI